jgi:hypothetical protein
VQKVPNKRTQKEKANVTKTRPQAGHLLTAGAAECKETIHASSKMRPKAWDRNLHSYEKTAIHFSSQHDLDYFIDVIWGEEELHGMPHVPAGDNTMIVPIVALGIIKQKLGAKKAFTVQQVIDLRELSSKKFVQLQQERNTL